MHQMGWYARPGAFLTVCPITMDYQSCGCFGDAAEQQAQGSPLNESPHFLTLLMAQTFRNTDDCW